MSKSSKIILWIVVIIAIAIIAWCLFGSNSSNTAPVSAPVTESAQNQQVAMATGTSPSNVPVSGLTTSPSDDSNAALNSDMSVLSTQSAAMDQDSAAANQPTSTQ